MTSTDPLIGASIGPYRVEAFLGAGGMGVVYRAQSSAGAPVALKLLAPELARSPEFRDRFSREAQWELNHPNVLPIYESGDADGHLYIAMRLVEGGDLKQILAAERTLAPRRAVSIFDQIAGALDAAHGQGVVHRDVKPQNILLERSEGGEEHAFLSDFGLVKRVAGQSSLTAASHLIGTAHYMAPELIQGEVVDGRADVYSLGCVLLETLTGDVPYAMDEEVAVLWSHVHKPVPAPTSRVPSLPDAIDAVITKALAKDREQRYLTAGDLAAAAAEALGHSKSRPRPLLLTSGERARKPLRPPGTGTSGPIHETESAAGSRGFIVGVAATLALVIGVTAFQSDRVRDAAASAISAGQELIEAAGGGDEPDPTSTSPTDQTRRPEGRKGPKNRDAIGLGLGASRGSTAPSDALSPPPGESSREDSRDGAPPVDGTQIGDSRPVVFGSIVTQRGGVSGNTNDWGLYAVDPDGTNVRLLYDDEFPGSNDDYDPAYSPDGKRIAFTQTYGLAILTLETGQVRTLSCPVAWCRHPAWSPDGDRLAFSGGETRTSTSVGWALWTVDADGSNPEVLYDGPGLEGQPAWSPNGAWIAFSDCRGNRSCSAWETNPRGDSNILAVSADGKQLREIAATRANETHPSWSRSGRRVVYASSGALYVLPAAGGKARRLTFGGHLMEPVWSPSGRWLAFSRITGSRVDIFKMRAKPRAQPINLSDGYGQSATW